MANFFLSPLRHKGTKGIFYYIFLRALDLKMGHVIPPIDGIDLNIEEVGKVMRAQALG